MSKEDKQIKKLHKMYDRLCNFVGKDTASKMVNEIIDKGIINGEITEDEALNFRRELNI